MKLRLDPWAAEYGTSYRAEEEEEVLGSRIVLDVELPPQSWRPLTARNPAPGTGDWVFIDGSRRVEARLLLEGAPDAFAFGAIGTYGVGAVRCPLPGFGRASYLEPLEIVRICAVSGTEVGQDFTIGAGGVVWGELAYRLLQTHDRDPDAVVRRIQTEMRLAEARLASRLQEGFPDAIIICDGPRPLLGHLPRAVGYVKTIHDLKVPPAQLETVRRLEQGQRSPMYLVETPDPRHRTFEWFLRLRDPRPWVFSLAGLVRLQVQAGPEPEKELARAQALADRLSGVLPRFASQQHQDPRAPQQLLPVRALEAELRRRMGSPGVVRRRLTAFLADSAAAGREWEP